MAAACSRFSIALLLALGTGMHAAHAADGPYLGAGIGVATFKDNLDAGGASDQDDASYRLFAGWRFDAVPLIDILPLGPLDLYGKAGVLEARLERTENGATTTRSGPSAFYGAGIGLYVWKLGIRAEYERYHVKDIDRVQMFSLNALVQF